MALNSLLIVLICVMVTGLLTLSRSEKAQSRRPLATSASMLASAR